MPVRVAAMLALTRTTSSSLFLCMSCFSSSTILDMASFSVSWSFSDNCKILKRKLCHNTETFWSSPWSTESVDARPLGAYRKLCICSTSCFLEMLMWFWIICFYQELVILTCSLIKPTCQLLCVWAYTACLPPFLQASHGESREVKGEGRPLSPAELHN